jgi:hypothetical protein
MAKKLSRAGIYSKKRKRKPGLTTSRNPGTRVEDFTRPYFNTFGVRSSQSGSDKKNLGH